jgi:hypothetical protein
MINLEKITQDFIIKGKNGGIFLDFAWETQAVDAQTYGDLTAIEIGIIVPMNYLRRYNQATLDRDTRKLPDARKFFDFLRPYLKGKKLESRGDSLEYQNFDDADKELSTYKNYFCTWDKNNKELTLHINGDLDLDDEWENSFEHDDPKDDQK